MKEIRSIVKAYQTIDFSLTGAALATLVRVEGSSYRRVGARMLVLDNGTYLGGISGGCLEGDALRRAQKAMALGKPSVITYDTMQDDDYQVGVGLGCQGIIDVLFTPLHPEDPNNPVQLLSAITDTRAPACMVAITACPPSMQVLGQALLYRQDEPSLRSFSIPSLAKAVLEDIKKGFAGLQSRTIPYASPEGEVKVAIEMILPALHVAAYGSNNDIYPLLQLAKDLGWDTTIVTNTVKADRSLFSIATRVLDHKEEKAPLIDPFTAVLLMSHDYKTDLHNLRKALHTPATYIGLLGPRSRTQKMYAALEAEGHPVSDADLARIYSPAGLDIGAATPEEIALSILAEIRSHFAGRQGMSLRLREGTIYGDVV